jgi:hypothetical protein
MCGTYFVGIRHGVEVFGRVGKQCAGSAYLFVVGGLVGYEVFSGVLRCFEEFGWYAASDHLDVLL